MSQSNTPLLSLAREWWDRDLLWTPADIGLFRYHAETRADYYSYILDRLVNVEDAYFPFYTPLVSKDWPQEQKDAVGMTRLFLDMDVRGKDTFDIIWKKAQFFATTFYDNLDLFFSAGKGFHFYIYLNPTTYGEMHRQRDKLYWNLSTWFQYLHDKRAFLSLDRVCRITLSKHSLGSDLDKPIRFKVPIDPTMSLQDILKRSEHPERYVREMELLYERKPKPLDYKVFLKSPDEILKYHTN